MRFLTVILSIYILALNLVLCEDSGTLVNEVKTDISEAISDEHNSNHHQDSDLCSPFCSCHCCHIQISLFEFLDFKIITPDFYSEGFYHSNGLVISFYSTILQPPQV